MTFGGAQAKPPVTTEEPLKHVIDEYRHRAQVVTCVCGWHGSTASPLGAPSAWTQHVRDSKTTPRR